MTDEELLRFVEKIEGQRAMMRELPAGLASPPRIDSYLAKVRWHEAQIERTRARCDIHLGLAPMPD